MRSVTFRGHWFEPIALLASARRMSVMQWTGKASTESRQSKRPEEAERTQAGLAANGKTREMYAYVQERWYGIGVEWQHQQGAGKDKYIFNIRSDIRRDTVIWQTDWAQKSLLQQGSTSGTNNCPSKTTNTQGTKHKKPTWIKLFQSTMYVTTKINIIKTAPKSH